MNHSGSMTGEDENSDFLSRFAAAYLEFERSSVVNAGVWRLEVLHAVADLACSEGFGR